MLPFLFFNNRRKHEVCDHLPCVHLLKVTVDAQASCAFRRYRRTAFRRTSVVQSPWSCIGIPSYWARQVRQRRAMVCWNRDEALDSPGPRVPDRPQAILSKGQP